MIGILPFAILLVLCAIGLGVWSGLKVVAAFRARKPIPTLPLLTLLSVLGFAALTLRIVIALTIGLEHSRAPFEYTRWQGAVCLVVVFIVPSVMILAYHFFARRRKQ